MMGRALLAMALVAAPAVAQTRQDPQAPQTQSPRPQSDVQRAAGPTGVTARLATPPGEITVGDPVALKLTVSHPPGTVFDEPDITSIHQEAPEGAEGSGAAAPPLAVEKIEAIQTRPPSASETSWSIVIRPFAPGPTRIAPVSLSYRLSGSAQPLTVTTEPLSIQVKSVLASDQEEPADIKGPWRIARDWWLILLIVAAAMAALAGLVILWLRRRRRRPAAPAEAEVLPSVPAESPYERALRELEKLIASRLLAEGKVKQYHVILSEIVKRFLGSQHRFDALDRTSREVLADLSRLGIGAEVGGRARAFLEACDLVKFAKHQPGRPDIDTTVSMARDLIETGRPQPSLPAEGVAA